MFYIIKGPETLEQFLHWCLLPKCVCVCVCQALTFMNVDFYMTFSHLKSRCVETFAMKSWLFIILFLYFCASI